MSPPSMKSKKPEVQKPNNQRDRFIEAAREAGCSEDEAEIRENMKRIAKAKVAQKPDQSSNHGK